MRVTYRQAASASTHQIKTGVLADFTNLFNFIQLKAFQPTPEST